MSRPIGLQPDDLVDTMARFGVAEAQVRRDHAISHVLAALSSRHRDELIFFGGTALSRTHLTDARLSEDIDLICTTERAGLLSALPASIGSALARSHGRLVWDPAWSSDDVRPAIARTPAGVTIQIQLLGRDGYPAWPTEVREIEQRYGDAPQALLRVPTLPSFAAWKLAAWLDRGTPRDLYDLWALARVDALDAEASALFAEFGPSRGRPEPWMFRTAPREAEWTAQLAAQTRLEVTAREALVAVRHGWCGPDAS